LKKRARAHENLIGVALDPQFKCITGLIAILYPAQPLLSLSRIGPGWIRPITHHFRVGKYVVGRRQVCFVEEAQGKARCGDGYGFKEWHGSTIIFVSGNRKAHRELREYFPENSVGSIANETLAYSFYYAGRRPYSMRDRTITGMVRVVLR